MSTIEEKAKEAVKLESFTGIDLAHVRKTLKDILGLFGREGIFNEYTKHDISHIDKMLNLCEWIIPEETQNEMTLGDYLMLTLSIYFHDLGLLVTKKEYESRDTNSEFANFIKDVKEKKYGSILQNAENKNDDHNNKFLYQEFVRKQHATRIKMWITQDLKIKEDLPEGQKSIVEEIAKLLQFLPENFKLDLAMICESHHLNDLLNLEKYKVEARYGSHSEECVNLQYVAIILRTADLLHITNDRTPSIQFNIIEPENTTSVIEWQKQMAVSAITPKKRRDEKGDVDSSLQPNEIEISAFFNGRDQADAYFGLMYYLQYVKEQFAETQKFIEHSQKKEGKVKYLFPWKDIDSKSSVRTSGFENKKFEFNLDQQNILNLLIGHTLYNDSSIVLRELIQNGIDAIKLYDRINNEKKDSCILIEWDTNNRTLMVTDTGTGMTVEDIERYFLTVGVSKYRTGQFKQQYPDFSPISRFGIGALSCFMIADNIDVITSVEEEPQVNHISIRNINNQYLLKKIERNDKDVPDLIKAHGTRIKLYVRESANITDVHKTLNHWIMFPYCKVKLKVNGDSFNIGFKSPKEVLQTIIERNGLPDRQFKIQEEEKNGITLAYATHLTPYYNDYVFQTDSTREYRDNSQDDFSPISLSIDGIRVESNTPGYNTNRLLAVANITGDGKAETNVARSAIEENEKQTIMLGTMYELYCKHIINQISLLKSNGYSDFKAIEEAGFLVRPLISNSSNSIYISEIKNEKNLFEKINSIPSIIVSDTQGKEEIINAFDFFKKEKVKIIVSVTFEAIKKLKQENNRDFSFNKILNLINADIGINEDELLFCNYSRFNPFHETLFETIGPSRIKILRDNRLIEFDYSLKSNNEDEWIIVKLPNVSRFNTLWEEEDSSNRRILIPKNHFIIEGIIQNEVGVNSSGDIFLSSGNSLTDYILEQFSIIENKAKHTTMLRIIFLEVLFGSNSKYGNNRNIKTDMTKLETHIDRKFEHSDRLNELWEIIDKEKLFNIILNNDYEVYDVNNWSRTTMP